MGLLQTVGNSHEKVQGLQTKVYKALEVNYFSIPFILPTYFLYFFSFGTSRIAYKQDIKSIFK
jgi:hypothetical protein